MAETDGPMNYKRAADYLGITVGTLRNLVHGKKISCFKPSDNVVFFSRENLDAYAYRNQKLADFALRDKADELLNEKS